MTTDNAVSKHRASAGAFSYCAIVAASLILAACGGGDDGSAAADGAASSASDSSRNQAPTIVGNPPTSAAQGSHYSYAPSASDADGDALTFSVSNLPVWANFDSSSGRISGTPAKNNIGVYANIGIGVTDGQGTVTLSSFSIEVVGTAVGAATLNWHPPTQNMDGSPLMDLAGYGVYWGTNRANLKNSVRLDNPGLSSYMVEQLTPATWYFATTAVDSTGLESALSNIVSKTIR